MGTIDYKAATWAGLITAVVFMMLEMIMVPLFMGGSPWGPPRMMGAILLGGEVLPPPATFDFGIFMAALAVHLPISVLFTIVTAFIIEKMSFAMALVVGAVLGFLLYVIGFYLMTDIWPWFAKARNWVSIFAHLVFGLVAAWAYMKLRIVNAKDRPATTT
jgi:hypothetical protein